MIISGCMRRRCEMKNVIGKLGFVILAIGVSVADSDNLLIPVVVTGFGILLISYGFKEVL